ncbi:uncharacterized protein LOC135936824 isoform X2 [Cloeon dipterum]|uniref:uncharacterized protein LOC135936824 isoform X2 n=1 Tax=Cloeon dipterum TaxID=197152 RepID=UPI00321FCCFA
MHSSFIKTKGGDPLCPLGFHPQVRWPTRCKRCFRDYKEHGGNRKDDSSSLASLRRDGVTTASTPALSSWSSQPAVRSRESSTSSSGFSSSFESDSARTRATSASSSDLSKSVDSTDISVTLPRRAAASWTSTPDLKNMDEETTSVTIRMPRVRTRAAVAAAAHQETPKEEPKAAEKEPDYRSAHYTFRRRTLDLTKTESTEKKPELTSSASVDSSDRPRVRRALTQPLVEEPPVGARKRVSAPEPAAPPPKSVSSNKADLDFMMKVKSSSAAKKTDLTTLAVPSAKGREKKTSSSSSSDDETDESDDSSSVACTETTETTIIDRSNDDEVAELKRELDTWKARCEKAEREKSDILLRRLGGTRETAPSGAEALKLQQRVNELQQAAEDLRDERKSLSLRVKELEEENESATSREPEMRRTIEDLRNKLSAAETLCEELMDENEEIKKEIRDLEEEIDEMQDNFREEQADEYTSLKKELEQTAKNCRILQFKLRKAERKAESLEATKLELERQLGDKGGNVQSMEKIRQLEKDLKLQSEVSERLQKETEDLKAQLAREKLKSAASNKLAPPAAEPAKKRTPMLGKSASGETVTRASLTRGGSQDDPVQLLRDLQDAMEREADMREQLRFAEEEGQNMRKKCSRLEDDNDSLAMQLKKMAMKARRRPSPSPGRLSTPEPLLHEKDEGIAEDDDPSELRLQLELNEQEAAVLRRKVEELEKLNESNQRKMKELQEKAKAASTPTSPRTVRSDLRPATSSAAVLEKKISVLEEESSELRKKLIEKERDYERLQTELTLAHKRSKTSARSRSLDSNEQALDLKRQLQVIEAEANVLRSKTQDLEAENEKLSTENKKLSIKAARGATPAKDPSEGKELKEKVVILERELAELRSKEKKPAVLAPNAAAVEVERLKNQLTKVEKENERLKEGGARLRTRTPKRPTDLTTKLQMKKMVDELELEVAELLAGLSKAQEGKADASEKQTAAAGKELEEIQKERDSLKAELAKTKESLQKDKMKSDTDLKKLKSDVVKSKEEVAKLQAENKSMKESLESLKTSQESAKKTQEEKAQVLSELEEAKALASAFQRESEEKIKEEGKKNEAERAKLQKELAEKTKKLMEAEKKAKETDEKLKKAEKILSGKKDKLAKAEKDLEAEREKVKQSESTQKEVAVGWLRERDELKANATEMSRKVEQLQEQLSGRVREVETLENSLVSERERVSELMSSSESSKRASTAAVEKQLEAAREELAAAKTRAAEISSQLEKAEKAKKEADDKAKKEISDLQKKLSDTESGRSTEVKKLELQVKEKEQEVRSLNNQLKSAQQDSGASSKKISELQDEFGKKIKELEKDLAEERHEYEDLTVRYEQLETEHVVTKAQLTMDREKAEGSVDMAHRELTTLERELQTLRETYNAKQDEWIKEKLDMQALVRDLEDKVQRSGGESLDNKRLKAQLDEKTTDFDKTKHELDVMTDQNSNLRKEADDLRRKLEDYERVAKIQRNMTADSAALDKEIKQLKSKMAAEEKSHKAEVAQLKLRYDSRVALISEEMQTLQNQVSKFKKERDSQRHMLEAAQKTIGELKASGKSLSTSASHMEPGDESEETRTKVASLEQSLACMEDELSDARLEASKLKTELVSERSAWEVKISEMQSRLNEFEEDRLISSGRTKIPGMRTRIELAWQKERDEQHRLLQETSTLARDLRQTLFEVERERDKERLESKRKIDQIKRSMEEELEENRKKITEMQYDLLELRDAHAKVRTTNEKLRRERERHEKERDENRQMTNARKRQDADEERKVNALLEQVDELMRLAPDLFPQRDAGGGSSLLPKAPNRSSRTNLSREPSPATGGREASVGVEDRKQLLQSTLSRLTEATSELRRHQRLGEDEKDRERARRTLGFRRAASTEADAPEESKKGKANGSGKKGLFRKSLSLEQTGGMAQDQKIWKGEGGSNSSLDVGSEVSLDSRFLNMPRREVSLDRLSTDSTQSDIVQDKKKKGFFGKLKKLASSRSIDNDADRQTGGGSLGGSGSDISVDISTADSGKKDKKGKLMGLFKKGSARSSSVEKSGGAAEDSMAGSTDSLQRPLRASSASRPLAPSSAAPATPATPAPTAKRYVR